MLRKLAVLFALVAAASTMPQYHAPAAYAAGPAARPYAALPAYPAGEDYDPNPSYSYGYDIKDALTGDSKSQQESRQGDTVQGSYSVAEPDGSIRTVDYTADPHNGFNAVVHKTAPGAHAPAAYAPAPAYAAAPIARVAAPHYG